MQRRNFIAAAGAAGVGALAGCAGLLGGQGGTDGSGVTTTPGPTQGDQLPPDQAPDDGYPPAFESRPPEQELSDGNFASNTVTASDVRNASSDVTVTLASIDAAYYWYARGEARFVDSRGRAAYDASHVFGAVRSTAGSHPIEQTPVGDWPTEDRVVCYCRCPHHLASIRAAELQQYGFEEVYVIDDGFGPWLEDRDYPVVGTAVNADLDPWTVAGRTSPDDAGQTAWARHGPSGQREATPVSSDGSYVMDLYFHGVDADSTLTVETPSYRVEGRLGDLADGLVTGDR